MHFFVDNFLIKSYAVVSLDILEMISVFYKYILRLKVSSLKLASIMSNEFASELVNKVFNFQNWGKNNDRRKNKAS